MIGIVVVTHGKLAAEMQRLVERVSGPQDQWVSIGIEPEDDPEDSRLKILDAVNMVDTGQGAIVLTDMFGGTPSNLSLTALRPKRVDVVAGVNMPMLVKLTSVRRNGTLTEVVEAAQDAGQRYIQVASKYLEHAPV